mgnify:CR=1 FL=1
MPDVLLRGERLHKSYMLGRTILPVLRGVDLDIQRGQFIVVVGTSGAGKSTLLHVLSGLDVPQRGQVFYHGEAMFEPEGIRRIPLGRDSTFAEAATDSQKSTHPGPAARRDQDGKDRRSGTASTPVSAPSRHLEGLRNRWLNVDFGFVFQFYHLLPEFDVLENVLLPQMVGQSIGGWLSARGANFERAHKLLGRVGLRDRLRHRRDGRDQVQDPIAHCLDRRQAAGSGLDGLPRAAICGLPG